MKKFAVLSAIGPDRPGIVADLTDFLHKLKANVEDSRMSILGGDFALILLFSVEEKELTQVLNSVGEIKKQTGLTVIMHQTDLYKKLEIPSLTWLIKAVSLDQPGIIHGLSEIMAEKGVNILELKSHIASAPISGTPVFSMEMRLSVPADKKSAKLKEELIRFGDRENIEIEIHIES